MFTYSWKWQHFPQFFLGWRHFQNEFGFLMNLAEDTSSLAVNKPLFIGCYFVVSFISPVWQWKVIISGFNLTALPASDWKGNPRWFMGTGVEGTQRRKDARGGKRNSNKIPITAFQSPLKPNQLGKKWKSTANWKRNAKMLISINIIITFLLWRLSF